MFGSQAIDQVGFRADGQAAGTDGETHEVCPAQLTMLEERAPTLPQDTKQVPYILHVSGFLIEDAELGQETRIRTIIGRELPGVLITVNPGYNHSFGATIPELLNIGTEADLC